MLSSGRHLIAETVLQPIYHTPNFYPQNPVLEPDKEWENTTEGAPYAAPFSDVEIKRYRRRDNMIKP